jgi:uncharacterized protein
MKIEREDNGLKGKFVILDNDKVAAEMTYTWAGDTKFIIDHTEVDESFAGKGYGKKLVLAAVDFAREHGFKILPLCPFAKKVFVKDELLHDVIF